MKKFMSILLCLTVIALMGCQAVPEEQSVISTANENIICMNAIDGSIIS